MNTTALSKVQGDGKVSSQNTS